MGPAEGFGSGCSADDLALFPPTVGLHACCESTAEKKVALLRKHGYWWLDGAAGE